jgi:hypothetical protein
MDMDKDEYIAALHDEIRRMEHRLKATVTVRDQFAMAALAGLTTQQSMTYSLSYAAKMSYEYADAMLKERETTNGHG